MSALAVIDLSSGYGEAIVVRAASIEVGRGEIVAVLGKNGMGKSTLLKTVMGYLPARTGRVRVFGEDVTGAPPHRVARRAVAFTPQEQAIFQDLTVEDNLRLALRDPGWFASGFARVGETFPFLRERRRQRAGTLSGGEQKMLLVARALMARPRLMLVDEISEGLQPSVVRRLAGVFADERDRLGTAMLLVEQNVRFALAWPTVGRCSSSARSSTAAVRAKPTRLRASRRTWRSEPVAAPVRARPTRSPHLACRTEPAAHSVVALARGRRGRRFDQTGRRTMARCETCDNDYDKAFEVTMMGETHTFDSFECATHALAPTCPHCGVRIAGHGVEQDGEIFAARTVPSRKRAARPRLSLPAATGSRFLLPPRRPGSQRALAFWDERRASQTVRRSLVRHSAPARRPSAPTLGRSR